MQFFYFSLVFANIIILLGIVVKFFLNDNIHNNCIDEKNCERDTGEYQKLLTEVSEIKPCLSADLIEEEEGSRKFFAIVIDAGSTGTRLHLFRFGRNQQNTALFYVEEERVEEVKPGLSSFARRPERAVDNLVVLIEAAKSMIPERLWRFTPITLKATAGLRLIAEQHTSAILHYVRNYLMTSGFLIGDEAISILSGHDEGVFGWFTLNILTDRLKHLVPDRTGSECTDTVETEFVAENGETAAAALDLGGGSTQITFLPLNPETFSEKGNKKLHHINVFNAVFKLYTHSYLGNGLISARMAIVQQLSNGNSLFTSCLPGGFTIKNWNFTDQQWTVLGLPSYSFAECFKSAEIFIRKSGVEMVQELDDHEIHAFGYFFDRGWKNNLLSVDQQIGAITVSTFKNSAVQACSRTASELVGEHWKPWQCLDLTYIYALLHSGYGLKNDKKIYLTKRLKNMVMSWALGAGYNLLHSYHQDIGEGKKNKGKTLFNYSIQ